MPDISAASTLSRSLIYEMLDTPGQILGDRAQNQPFLWVDRKNINIKFGSLDWNTYISDSDRKPRTCGPMGRQMDALYPFVDFEI